MASSRHPIQAPGPKAAPLIGNMREVNRLGLLGFVHQIWQQYGDVSQFQFGPTKAMLFVRPEHVEHILLERRENFVKGASYDKLRMWLGHGLLTSEGEDWRKQRQLMAPSFSKKNVNYYAEIMTAVACEVRQRWQTLQGQPINLNAEMMRLTMSIVSRTMFTADIVDEASQVDVALQTILRQSVQRMTALFDPPLFIPTPANQAYTQAMNVLDNFIYDIIDRRSEQKEGNDLLWHLIEANHEESGDYMDPRRLRDEVLVTFFAGHETTAQLLTWTWLLLAQHPEVEAKLHDELARALKGHSPFANDIPRLPYTRMVLDEALRLYPPVAFFPRDVVSDDVIGGYAVPKGSLVFLGPYITHRHPDYWERPNEFYPEHFTQPAIDQRPTYAYYPFSAGPRTCLGNHFAMLEATLVLAELAQRFYVRLVPGQNLEPEFVGALRPRNATLLVTLEPREITRPRKT